MLMYILTENISVISIVTTNSILILSSGRGGINMELEFLTLKTDYSSSKNGLWVLDLLGVR